jgi:hypothetical protein
VDAQVEEVADPLERIRVLIGAHVSAMLADRDKHATMLTELRALSVDRRAEVVALRDSYEELVRSVLERAQSEGAIRADIPAKHLALGLLDLMNWAIFWFRRDGDLGVRDLVDVFAAIFLGGVARRIETTSLEP